LIGCLDLTNPPQLQIVQLLLQEGALQKPVKTGVMDTPLTLSIFKGHNDVINLLVDDPKVDLNATNCKGETPVFMAAMMGKKDIVMLLHDRGADIFKACHDGATPLFIAAQQGFMDILMYLHDNGASLDSRTEVFIQHNTTQHNTTQHNTTQHTTSQGNTHRKFPAT